MHDRLNILLANIQYTFRQETAHWANNWGNIFSTIFYTVSQILFIEVLFSNVKDIAGYSRDQLLLFMFIGQVGFYVSWVIHGNLDELIVAVNKGSLDALLIRPVPALFYITFKKVKIFSMLRDCIPSMVILGLVINWSSLNLNLANFAAGLAIALMGIVCTHVMHLLATLPVFWLGESSSILELSENIEYNIGKVIPLEGFGKNFKIIFSTIIPVLISAGISTSVALGKSNALTFLGAVFLVTVLALFVRQYAWNKAIMVYTSASS